jgi:hypothetical protein
MMMFSRNFKCTRSVSQLMIADTCTWVPTHSCRTRANNDPSALGMGFTQGASYLLLIHDQNINWSNMSVLEESWYLCGHHLVSNPSRCPNSRITRLQTHNVHVTPEICYLRSRWIWILKVSLAVIMEDLTSFTNIDSGRWSKPVLLRRWKMAPYAWPCLKPKLKRV